VERWWHWPLTFRHIDYKKFNFYHDSVRETSQVKEEGHEGHEDDDERLDEGGHDVESHLKIMTLLLFILLL